MTPTTQTRPAEGKPASTDPPIRTYVTLNHLYENGAPSEPEEFRRFRKGAIPFLRRAEELGFDGVLIFTANRMPNPWVVAQMILENTERIAPLVAIRPDLAHPFEVYSRIMALSNFYGRVMDFNLVAGANRDEHLQLGDMSDHAARYAMLAEYASVLKALLDGGGGCTFHGSYYDVDLPAFSAARAVANTSRFLVSGSSREARDLAGALSATRLMPYDPSTPAEPDDAGLGLPLGIVTRPDRREAWAEADRVFPDRQNSPAVPEMSRTNQDSHWREVLADQAGQGAGHANGLWLEPFAMTRLHHRGRRSNHAWIVGSYDDVARFLRDARARGWNTLVLYLEDTADLFHVREMLELVFPKTV